MFFLHLYFQNLLVARGSNNYHLLDSTEVFRDGEWTVVAPLPLALEGVRGVTLDNTVFMTGLCVPTVHYDSGAHYQLAGGTDSSKEKHAEVWRYDPASGAWTAVIYMREVRSFHGVTRVNYTDFCEIN